MGSYTQDFRLNPDIPEQQRIIEWLGIQTNKSAAIREVLIAHVSGSQTGGEITEQMLWDKLCRIEQRIGQQVVVKSEDSMSETGARIDNPNARKALADLGVGN